MKSRFSLTSRLASSTSNTTIKSAMTRKYGTEIATEFMHLRSYLAYDQSLFKNSGTIIKLDTLASGTTPLHTALVSGCQVTEIEMMIDEYGIDAITTMARTPDDANILPIDLVNPQNTELTSLISALTITHQQKKNPTLQQITSNYNVSADSQLYINLELGVQIVDAVNSMQIQSSTKPELNMDKNARKIASSCVNMHRNTFGQIARLRKHVPDEWDRLKTMFVNMEASFIKRARAGNCYEYAITALSLLRAMDSSHTCELYTLHNRHGNETSGHDFLVIDREAGSNKNDFNTFGKHAVIIDAWGKSVIPAANTEALDAELTSNEQHVCYLTKGNPQLRRVGRVIPGSTRQFNVNPKYNPTVHAIAPIFRIGKNSLFAKIKNEEAANHLSKDSNESKIGHRKH